MNSIETRTYLETAPALTADFQAWRRQAQSDWRYFLTGEWSNLSGNSGRHVFQYSCSEDRVYWAIMKKGFPTRVVGSAKASVGAQTELVLGSLLKAISDAGGPHIDDLFDFPEDVDADALWDAYTASK